MRLIVTGKQGQIARGLAERGPAHGVDVTLVGRPELDLVDAESVARVLASVRGDVIVNAAAYTKVDEAEIEAEAAFRINALGAGAVARAAALRGLPMLHLSTDYVFDGLLDRPYREDDPVGPLGVYGSSKLAGERAIAQAHPCATIIRTSWVYSPYGVNFVRAMLRLSETRDTVSVVDDQRGAPSSALDLADGLIVVARKLCRDPTNAALSGVFHMTGAGEASWADFAEEVFAEAARHGRPRVAIRRIGTKDYPTPARRPANSRLSNCKLARLYSVALPDWRLSVRACVGRILKHANIKT